MRKEFVMRGQTASGETEILQFGKYKAGYAKRLVEFKLWPSTNLPTTAIEMQGTITAGKTAIAPTDPNFNDDGLIGVSAVSWDASTSRYGPVGPYYNEIVNDTYIITQNLILMVQDSASTPINWHCRFESVKMTGAEEAAVNYKQFAISDE